MSDHTQHLRKARAAITTGLSADTRWQWTMNLFQAEAQQSRQHWLEQEQADLERLKRLRQRF